MNVQLVSRMTPAPIVSRLPTGASVSSPAKRPFTAQEFFGNAIISLWQVLGIREPAPPIRRSCYFRIHALADNQDARLRAEESERESRDQESNQLAEPAPFVRANPDDAIAASVQRLELPLNRRVH